MKPKIDLSNNLLNRERIGSILKNFRETNEMSQRDVARAAGYVHTNFISMIETGRSAPPLGKLLEICEAIKCDMVIIPIILKYLYPDTWTATVAALQGCPDIFQCKSDNIDTKVEKEFIRLIKEWCSV